MSLPLRPVKFFSVPQSLVVRGPSGKTYFFNQTPQTSSVSDPRDISYLRTRRDVYEEGTSPKSGPTVEAEKGRGRPITYVAVGRSTADPTVLVPPTPEQLREAEERRRRYEQQEKDAADAVSAQATVLRGGTGTKEAQMLRQMNKEISAGRIPPRVAAPPPPRVAPPPVVAAPPVAPPAPKREAAADLEQIDERQLEELEKALEEGYESTSEPEAVEPDPTPEPEPEPETEPEPEPEGFKCRKCGRVFPTAQGRQFHEVRWCKKGK